MATVIDISNITDGDVDGTGSFDLLAKSMANHLQAEYEEGRITGADYANVYLGAIQNAMAQSIQFELSKAQSGFSADLTEEQGATQVSQTAYLEAQTKVLLERGGFR